MSTNNKNKNMIIIMGWSGLSSFGKTKQNKTKQKKPNKQTKKKRRSSSWAPGA